MSLSLAKRRTMQAPASPTGTSPFRWLVRETRALGPNSDQKSNRSQASGQGYCPAIFRRNPQALPCLDFTDSCEQDMMTPTSEKSVGTAHDGMTIPCDDAISLSPALVKPPARAFIALEREKSPRVLRVALDYEERLVDQSFRVKKLPSRRIRRHGRRTTAIPDLARCDDATVNESLE